MFDKHSKCFLFTLPPSLRIPSFPHTHLQNKNALPFFDHFSLSSLFAVHLSQLSFFSRSPCNEFSFVLFVYFEFMCKHSLLQIAFSRCIHYICLFLHPIEWSYCAFLFWKCGPRGYTFTSGGVLPDPPTPVSLSVGVLLRTEAACREDLSKPEITATFKATGAVLRELPRWDLSTPTAFDQHHFHWLASESKIYRRVACGWWKCTLDIMGSIRANIYPSAIHKQQQST